jgi:hypothetical protein
MTPNGDQRYGRPKGRLYFMYAGGYDYIADRNFAHPDFVWWRLLRPGSLVVITGFLALYHAEGTWFPQDGGRAPSIEAGPTEHRGFSV